MRVDAKTLFNGANSPARLDHVHSSHACSLRRYHAAVERTARAAPYAPPTEAGASRPIFLERLKSRRICSNDQSLRKLACMCSWLRLKVDMPNETKITRSVRRG
jgi:hypothetical protein